MTLCNCCNEEAVGTVKGVSDAVAQPLCETHARERRAALDNALVAYTYTSILHVPETPENKLAASLKLCEEIELQRQRLAISKSQLEGELNRSDQERQALAVQLSEANLAKTARESELYRAGERIAELEALLALANQRLESLQVEDLPGMNADPAAGSPATVIE